MGHEGQLWSQMMDFEETVALHEQKCEKLDKLKKGFFIGVRGAPVGFLEMLSIEK